ncbi:flagellar biosynthetic protein FliQ [Sphingomonas colocasiae]|uniref:flagellar biosynthetic protein FliQ n=1 Tax=Sphingomonas colocasiae TaxID=1848973 RepID=UPI001FE3E7F1|nr:flagellar biosynthetic protein FliQ [Sphingomonas colocasiae]
MGADRAISMLDGMLWRAALVSAPLLFAILLVGVIISIVQVATQVQEMTLTFVPKLIVATLVLVFLGSWMMRQVSQFAEALFLSIPSLVN